MNKKHQKLCAYEKNNRPKSKNTFFILAEILSF